VNGKSDIKFIDVQEAKAIYNFNNIKGKFCRTIAATWCNKICATEQPFPKYIEVEVRGNSLQSSNINNAGKLCTLNQ